MELVGYIATSIVFLFVALSVFITVFGWLFRSKSRTLPKLAGTAIPETGEGFDISKRYDIAYSSGDYGGHFVDRLQAVRIIGYVGREDDESGSKMYMRARWMVVEFADGRRAYIIPHTILSMQESVTVVSG